MAGWVTIARVADPVQANLMRNRLEEAGIETLLADENTVATAWVFANALGGIKLQVPPEEAERARELLETLPGSEDLFDHESIPDRRTEESARLMEIGGRVTVVPAPGDEDEERKPTERERNADRALRCSVAALLFWPLLVYSLALVIKVAFSDERLEAKHRRNAWWAGWLTLPALLILYLFYLVSPTLLEGFRSEPPVPEQLDRPSYLVGRWQTAEPTPGRPFLSLELRRGGTFRFGETEGLEEHVLEGTWGSDGRALHFRVRDASTTRRLEVGGLLSWDLVTRRPQELVLRTDEGKIRLRKVGD